MKIVSIMLESYMNTVAVSNSIEEGAWTSKSGNRSLCRWRDFIIRMPRTYLPISKTIWNGRHKLRNIRKTVGQRSIEDENHLRLRTYVQRQHLVFGL